MLPPPDVFMLLPWPAEARPILAFRAPPAMADKTRPALDCPYFP